MEHDAKTEAAGVRRRKVIGARRILRVGVLVPIAVALAAGYGVTTLHRHADDRRRGEILLARIEAVADRQNVEESAVTGLGIVVQRKPSMTFQREVHSLPEKIGELRDQALEALSGIAELGLEGRHLTEVRESYLEYQEVLDTQIGLLRAGRFDEAWIFERERVDVSYDVFHDAVREADAEYAQLAKRAISFADVGTFVTIALALASLWLLRRRAEKQRRAFEKQLQHQAFHDPLTNLANRALLKERVDHALARLNRHKEPVAVLFLDLDDFKSINDTLGHECGDELLIAVSRRLLKCTRGTDTVARLGGDEFAIVLEELVEVENASMVAARILDSFRQPFQVNDRKVLMSASVGIAVADKEHESPEHLLGNADVAMYSAKAEGKGRSELYKPGMRLALMEQHSLETDLRLAIDRDELVLHYQPILDLESDSAVGVEALVRWAHPRKGLMMPGEFIPLAEQTGLILAVGQWVLEAACRQAQIWHAERPGQPRLKMSVNLSARQFQHPKLVEDVARVLEKFDMDPANLILEITESTLMHDTRSAVAKMQGLKALGVQLAIDDFGTGYSSLNYLRRFPIDILKIDKSFIDDVAGGPEDAAFTEAIVRLGRSLRLQTLAEGIEREDQLDELRRLRSGYGQGYLFAKPAPPEDVERYLPDPEMAEPDADERFALGA